MKDLKLPELFELWCRMILLKKPNSNFFQNFWKILDFIFYFLRYEKSLFNFTSNVASAQHNFRRFSPAIMHCITYKPCTIFPVIPPHFPRGFPLYFSSILTIIWTDFDLDFNQFLISFPYRFQIDFKLNLNHICRENENVEAPPFSQRA